MIPADTAGCTKAFLAHIRQLREYGVTSGFSVGWAITDRERTAIACIPEQVPTAAIDTRIEDRILCGKKTGLGIFPPASSRSTPRR